MNTNVTEATFHPAQIAFTQQSSSSASCAISSATSTPSKENYKKCDFGKRIIEIFADDPFIDAEILAEDHLFKVKDIAIFLSNIKTTDRDRYEQCVTNMVDSAANSDAAKKAHVGKIGIESFLKYATSIMDNLEKAIEKFRETIVTACENETTKTIAQNNFSAELDELICLYFDYGHSFLRAGYIEYIAQEICFRSNKENKNTASFEEVVRSFLELIIPHLTSCPCTIL